MILVQAFLRGAIVFVIAGLLTVVLQNRSAAVRHHIWASAIVIQLAILAFIPILPPIALPIVPTITAFTDAPASNTTETVAAPAERTNDAINEPVSNSQIPKVSRSIKEPTDWKSIIFYTWLIGATLVLLRYIVGTLLMARIASQGKRVEEGEWLSLSQKISRELQITRPVTMLWGGKLSIPITWGVLYPMILLPESAMEWPEERRRFVLVHEMAHVKRFDALTQFVAQLTLAVFWFSPFVWLSEWRLRVEREHACDDVVLHHGTEASLYADELLQMVRSLVSRKSARPAFAALAMARRSEFEGRMLAILDPERRRGTSTITSSIVFIALSLLIAAPLAAVDPFAFKVHVVEPPSPSPTTKPSAVANPLDCEFGKGQSTSTHVLVNEKHPAEWDINIKLARANRCVAADIEGSFVLNDDDSDIEQLGPNAHVQLREVTADHDIEVRITPTAEGLHTDISNTGSGPMNSTILHQWIGRVLPEIMREAAVEPEARMARMYKAHGLRGTIETIDAIGSPSSRRMHYVALAKMRRWDDDQLTQISRAATRSLGSSDLKLFTAELPQWTRFEKGQPQKLDKSNDWLEEGLSTITSSNDLREALSAHLPDADKEKLLMLLRASQKMQSSYDLTTFLTAAAPFAFPKRNAALEDAWFDALSKSTSSYDRSNALMAAVSFAYGNPRLKEKIIDATRALTGSDKVKLITALAAVR